jgi:N-methylhydantoinase A
VGVDTGGTFTDFVFQTKDGLNVFKLPSTPADPSLAITEGLRRISEETGARLDQIEVVHGTTVGTNALLTRRGARACLVTTKGFEDVLAIGRQARPSLYDLNATKPEPLVSDELRFGARERVAANGEVLEELTDKEIAALVRRVQKAKPESIAICLLFSFVHPEHERRLEKALSKLGVPLSVSHNILPEYREFERTSTICVNAYLQPLMGRYLTRLQEFVSVKEETVLSRAFRRLARADKPPKGATQNSLRVMQSSGGSISATVAADEPARTILSGPAGGIVGSLRVAQETGFKNIITFDMGGTSTDVALCDKDGMRMTREAVIAGMPVAVPMMDIHTVGAGGGSIARVDEGGSLRVGPESAGTEPGPACYGRGAFPTVTDAHLVLNHFGGAGLLGGDFKLDEERARKVLGELAQAMSKVARKKVSEVEAALGVMRVARVNMEKALRVISVERGYDPREFSLVPFGGAGGLHAVELARALRIPRVIVPASPGALSAIGCLASDVVKDWSKTVMLEAGPTSAESAIEKVFDEMESQARAALQREGFDDAKQKHERILATRYKGQSFELELRWTRNINIAAAFHRAHEARYGYKQEANTVEIVSARLRSSGLVQQLKRAKIQKALRQKTKPREYASVYFSNKAERTAIYERERLQADARLETPCIVREYSATTLILKGAIGFVDEFGNLIVEESGR